MGKRKDYFSENKKEYHFHNSLMEAFEQSAEKNPDAIALQFRDKVMTYHEFNQKVNQYAAFLQSIGVTIEVPVGIHMKRSMEMMIAIYAVLKAGGTYVPIDPDYPENRILFIAQDMDLQIILNNVENVSEKLKEKRNVVSAEELEEKSSLFSKKNIKQENMQNHAAYIIFTSGSTGKPKGAIIEHKAALNRLYWMQDYLQLKLGEKVMQKTPISFDVSVWELFWPLMYGATLVIAEPGGHKEPAYLVDCITKNNISVIHFVPSMLQVFLMYQHSSACTSLKKVVCSGEALEKYHAERFFETLPESGLYNLYGPTEATVDVTYYECKKGAIPAQIPIGKAVSNCELYILDQDGKPVPAGEEGELYIGGICLCRGYHNRPDLNKERFVKNTVEGASSEYMYKTGDLAKFNEQGEILYLGRSDFQVKLRGLRIELGEIESVIRKNDNVQDTVVTVHKEDLDDSRLIAYMIPQKDYGTDGESDKNRVEEWKAIFDDTYAEERDEAAEETESDFSGWKSSYTGKQIPDSDMEKWVESTVQRISKLNNQRVLELGCGTGLLLYKLAPKTTRYVGVDLSDIAVNHLKEDLKSRGAQWEHVSVYQGAADDISFVKEEKFDCVVINSVIQLFPSIQYLYEVIEKALTVLEDGGKLFIGDVRDLKFLKTFHQSVQYSKAAEETAEALRRKTEAAVQNDKELLVSQEFFQGLGGILSEITSVEIMAKNFDVINELTKFRYDVVLYKNAISAQQEETIYDYQDTPVSIEDIENILLKKKETAIKFIHVPNTMLSDEQKIYAFAEQEGIKPDLSHGGKKKFWPYAFYELGEKVGRKCLVQMKNQDEMEVVYCGKNQEIYSVAENALSISLDNLNQYATDPTKKGNEEQLIQQVRELIAKELPDYMMPSQFVIMEEFPLLPNGKLNRKALPVPAHKKINRASEYVAPKTALECELCSIWERILKVDAIGMKDSFLELGGHSLLAIRLFDILAQQYGRQVSLSRFMKEPTIEGLIKLLETEDKTSEKLVFEKAESDREHLNEPFPLSDMQQAYLIGSTDAVSYGGIPTHVYTEFEFYNLDAERFEKAINDLIERHDMLRTVIGTDSTQRILKQVPYYKIRTENIGNVSEEQVKQYIENLRNEMFYREYEVSSYPLFEIRMTKIGADKTQVHICYDNIILDGASQGIMIEDMLHLYREGKESLEPITFSFRDYLLAEQKFHQEEPYRNAMDYWKRRCTSLPSRPALPVCTLEEGAKRYVRRKEAVVEAKTWAKLKQLSTEFGVTANTLLVSAFSEVIERWSGSKRFCLNLPTFHRFPFHKEVEMMLGEFGSVHLLEVDRSKGKDFLENTRQMQKQFWEDMDYDIVSGVDVLRELAMYREDTLMPVVFTNLLTRDKRRSFLHEEVNTTYWRSQSSQVWLDAVVSESKGDLCIDWDYTDGLFEEEMIQDMFQAYVTLLEQLAADKELWKKPSLDVMPEQQKKKRLQYNETEETIPEYLLHQFFYEQVKKDASRVCCICDGETKTYHEMYQNAMELSDKLTKQHVRPDELIAVLLPKGWKQIAAVLGILFSGAAYLPLDMKWPNTRLNELLSDSNVRLVISDVASDNVDLENRTIIRISDEIKSNYPLIWEPKQTLENLAYVIYTSGSTGKPKGVAIEHKAASNTILDINQKFRVTNDDRTFALSELNFDLSVYDIFGMFAAGGAIVIPTAEQKSDVSSWECLVEKHHISIWNTVPSLMELFLNECTRSKESFASIRTVLMSGDWIPVTVPDRIHAINSSIQVSSLGGATEASIWSIYYPVTEQMEKRKSIPYGRPLANQQFYVLDSYYRDCPEYVTGELFIGGKGLATCYWGDEKKTSEKFIIHPVTGQRLYATGDLGRFLGDNNIEFIGRKDFQVKVNGYRIELGEIESVMEELSAIEKCIADVKEGEHGQKLIAAFYIANETVDKQELIAYLSDRIPHYMIPAYFIPIAEIPVTDNGKVNRNALSIPKTEQKETTLHGNRQNNKAAQFVLETCRELLGVQDMSLDGDFFAYGGNSITIMRVMTRIKRHYQVNIKLQELFADTSLHHWVKLIEKQTGTECDSNTMDNENINLESVPLTAGQEEIILNDLIYHRGLSALSATMKIKGDLNIPRLENAIKEAIRKHAILNVDIKENGNGNFVQVPSDEIENVLLVIPFEEDLEYLEEYYIEKAEWNFDVLNEKLYNFELLSLGNQEYLFCVTMHHIISDEFTFEVLFHDIMKAYKNELDKEQEKAFLKYAYWQSTEQGKKEQKTCLDYWKKKLSNIEMKDFYDGAEGEQDEGSYYELKLPKDAFGKLTKLCSNAETSLFAGVLAMYAITLSKVLGEDICIGIPVSGRGKTDEDDVCGYFINMSVVRIELNPDSTFLETLAKVSNEMLETIENSAMPLASIIRELDMDRRYMKLPVNVDINILSAKPEKVAMEDVIFEPFTFTKHIVGHNIGALIEENEEKCYLSYRNSMPSKYITPVLKGFEKVWAEVIEHPAKKIIEVLAEIEKGK